MAKYCYAAKFTPEGGGYCVEFPDVSGCRTCGDNLGEAIFMAEDALSLMLTYLEDEGEPIPEPSKTLDLKDGEFLNWIYCDTIAYRKKINNKSIRKTLTLPQWLNTLAEEADVNFSQTLQEALKKKLKIA